MTVRRSIGLAGALLLAVTTSGSVSQIARAEPVVTPVVTPTSPQPQWRRAHRSRAHVASAPVRSGWFQVASIARNDCFWCNVRITGLGF